MVERLDTVAFTGTTTLKSRFWSSLVILPAAPGMEVPLATRTVIWALAELGTPINALTVVIVDEPTDDAWVTLVIPFATIGDTLMFFGCASVVGAESWPTDDALPTPTEDAEFVSNFEVVPGVEIFTPVFVLVILETPIVITATRPSAIAPATTPV